jgi:hypothetical protein
MSSAAVFLDSAARTQPRTRFSGQLPALILGLSALCAGRVFAEAAPDAYSAVDPFIGTQGAGHTFPGAGHSDLGDVLTVSIAQTVRQPRSVAFAERQAVYHRR